MRKVIGIDVGSRTTKIVQLVDRSVNHFEIFDTGHDPLSRVEESLKHLEASKIIATGYGRHLIRDHYQTEQITEITTCARGAIHLFPNCRTILDMGGQDCKAIRLGEEGKVADFEMNDRCAAGTGRFLEVMAQTFDMSLPTFIRTAMSATNHIPINSMCTVFAESEVISLLTSSRPRNEIALGLHTAIAARLASMLEKVGPQDDLIFVGGGAKNDCLHSILERQMRRKIHRPENPQIVVALGAAIIADGMI